MYDFRKLVSQPYLGVVYSLVLETAHLLDFRHGQKGKQFKTLFHVGVVYVAPILIKIVRRRLVFVKPHRALGGFAHFRALRRGKQRKGHGKSGL